MSRKNTSPNRMIELKTYPTHPIMVGLFIVFILMIWLTAYYFIYDTSLYYFYQFTSYFAVLLNLIFLFALFFLLIKLFDRIYKQLFSTEISFQITPEAINMSCPASKLFKPQQFKWDEIASIRLLEYNQSYPYLQIELLQKNTTYQLTFRTLFEFKNNQQKQQIDQLWSMIKKQSPKALKFAVDTVGKDKQIYSLSSDVAVNQRYQDSQIKRQFKLIFGALLAIIVVICLILYISKRQDGISLDNKEQPIDGTNFRSAQDQIYIWKQGRGHFLLPDATTKSFIGLSLDHLPDRAPELYSNVGKTSQHVYWQDHILEKLNPQTTQYLGNDYSKDSRSVYFQDKQISNADAKTFSAILHPKFNALVYFYAKDQKQVYYQNIALNNLNPTQAQAFLNSKDYVHDQKNVYYQQYQLKNLNAQNTQIYVGANRFSDGLNLASDGHYFYLNQNPLPEVAYGKYFGSHAIDPKQLKIVATQSSEPYPGFYHFIFADRHRIYIYDEFYQRLVQLYDFSPNIIEVTQDHQFQVNAVPYTFQSKLIRTSSQRSGTQTHGFVIKLINENDQSEIADYFARIATSFSPRRIFTSTQN